jgi:glutamate N-acetyltransferase / amino-acid N-acetyltransferase
MPVNLVAPNPADLLAIPGIRLGIAQAGVRKANRDDLTVLLIDEGAQVAGVFTQNRFCAAPVQLCRTHLARALEMGIAIRAMVINTGNANAGTGADGLSRAMATCIGMAQELDLAPEQVLPFSTGVIMESLPSDRIIAGLPAAIASAAPGRWGDAARAIMTTDTVPKAVSRSVTIGSTQVSISGISKGAGMIRPNMATMLGFLGTDARLAPGLLQALMHELAEASFNRITVDGDTSTNDSFVAIATGAAQHAPITSWASPEGAALKAALVDVAVTLAQAIVRDGEGATKFISVTCSGAATQAEALKVCYAIAHSPLVKTALYASDPNLGRILAATGYAGIDDLDQSKISMHIGPVHVVQDGGRLASYVEADASKVMQAAEIDITVGLGRGSVAQTVWTCDFSENYVKINADYRS